MEEMLMDKIIRVKVLEETTKELKQLVEKEEEKLRELQQNCNHVIIVSKIVARCQVNARCLFCKQAHTITDTYEYDVPKERIINGYSLKRYRYFSINEIYESMETHAQKILAENPNMTETEVAKELKNFFNLNDY